MLNMFLQLHALGVPAGHFTHIKFDEAGQAGETLLGIPVDELTADMSLLQCPILQLWHGTHTSADVAWIGAG